MSADDTSRDALAERASMANELDTAIKRAEAAEREARQAANRAALSHKAALMAQADTKAAELRADMAEIRWRQRVDEIANAAAQLRANATRANLTLQAVIDHHDGHISTHYEDCWMNHAGCLAVLVKHELNDIDIDTEGKS